jgi:hypothetical protein
LSASRFAGTLWNLTRSANHFSSSGLVITCSGIKGKRGECGKLEGAAGLRIVRRGCCRFANQAAGAAGLRIVRRVCGSCGGVAYLVHILSGRETSPNVTVLHEAKQLRAKQRNFLHQLTLVALVTGKTSKDQRCMACSMLQKKW